MALKVLLADDSVPAQNMGKKILIDAGYEVLTVSNGLEALRKIADAAPDIAILDIFMPGYNGLEVCDRLRHNAATSELPVILSVGKLEPYRAEDGEKVRSNAVIVKPFAAAELISAVRSLVGLPFAMRPAPSAEPPAPPAPAVEADIAEPPAPAPAEAETQAEAPLPESVLFNPGARRTPFSASAIEDLSAREPAVEEPGAEEPGNAVGTVAVSEAAADFALEFELPAAAAEPALASAAPIEWWQPEAETGTQNEAAAQELQTCPEPPAVAVESADMAAEKGSAEEAGRPALAIEAAEPEAVVNAVPAPPELNAPEQDATSLPDAPAVDSWPVQFAAAALPPVASATTSESVPAESASAQLAPDRESRLRAFEELFKSDAPFPLETESASLPDCDVLAPEQGAQLEQHEFAPQLNPARQSPYEAHSEMQAVLDGSPDELQLSTLAAPASDIPALHAPAMDVSASTAAPMEGTEPVTVAEAIPSGELRMDTDSLADWLSTGRLPQAEASPASAPQESLPPQPDPDRDEAAAFYAEHSAPSPELPEEADGVEASESMVCYLAKERRAREYPAAEAGRETSLSTAREAAPVELAGTALELPQAEPEPSPQEMASAEPAGAEPEPYLPEPDNSEANVDESVSAPANLSPAMPSSANPRSEAERVHQAVENVLDRFRPLLVAAIARELARLD